MSGPPVGPSGGDQLLQQLRRFSENPRTLTDGRRTHLWWTAQSRVASQARAGRQRWLVARAALGGAMASAALIAGATQLGRFAHTAGTPARPALATASDWRVLRMPLGTLYLAPLAEVTIEASDLVSPAGDTVRLASGWLCAEARHRNLEREGPLWVEAPGLKVRVVGTSFCIDAEAGHSRLAVEAGLVEVGGAAQLGAGGSVTSDDLVPRLPPAASSVGTEQTLRATAPAAARPCDHLPSQPPGARRDCYAAAAAGRGLAAEIALYSLAALDRAAATDLPTERSLGDLALYQQRFPHGQLAPEVQLQLIEQLTSAGRGAEAEAQGHEFARRFPWHPRAAEFHQR